MNRWRDILALGAARLRKLRRDPVQFVEDARSPMLRDVGLRTLVGWTHVADALDGNLWCAQTQWARRKISLTRDGTKPGAPTRWVLRDGHGRPPTCWPRRVRVHVRGGEAVLSVFDRDGVFRSGALATPLRPALLSLAGVACDVSVQFLNAEGSVDLWIEPVGRSAVYHGERKQHVVRTTALRRALPPGRPAFAKVSQPRYQAWIARNRATGPVLVRSSGLKLSVLMAVEPGVKVKQLRAALASVRAQSHTDWELLVADLGAAGEAHRQLVKAAAADPRVRCIGRPEHEGVASALNALGSEVAGGAVAFLAPHDRLAPEALATMATALHPSRVEAAYSDEDWIGDAGVRSGPSFKPNFDYERLLSHNYIGGLFAIRLGRWSSLGGFRPEYDGIHFHDLLLRLSEAAPREAIRHIPEILYHRRRGPQRLSADSRSELRRRLVVEHLERRRRRPTVVAGAVNRLVWPLPKSPPRVRVVVPTRDRPDLLGPCAAGVLNATDYPSLELVIVDNGSRTEEALSQLDQLARNPRVSVLQREGPFNFSALCNSAVMDRLEGLLAFVNDDILVVEPGWLKEMATLAMRPTVGAVGAKLFYPDGRIQHAGVVLGLGSDGAAGHEFRGAPSDEVGPQSRLVVTREVSAVTAGCLVVDASKFHAVGGFDEDAFAVSYNDVDLCLRLQDRGWRTLWTPHARLIHLESASRKRERDAVALRLQAKEASSLRRRWAEVIAVNGYYHPALSRVDETFSLAPLQHDLSPR